VIFHFQEIVVSGEMKEKEEGGRRKVVEVVVGKGRGRMWRKATLTKTRTVVMDSSQSVSDKRTAAATSDADVQREREKVGERVRKETKKKGGGRACSI
jgi:hypothetical protein